MERPSLSRATIAFAALALTAALAACGGGGGGGGYTPPGGGSTPIGSPTATASPTASPGTGTFSLGAQPTTAPLPATGGYTGTVSVPAGSGTGTITTSLGASGTPVLQIADRKSTASTSNVPLLYITITAQTALTLTGIPGFTIALPSGAPSGNYYIAEYENPLWTTIAGPATPAGGSVTFPTIPQSVSLQAGQSLYLVTYVGTIVNPSPSASPSSSPSASPSPTPTPLETPAATTSGVWVAMRYNLFAFASPMPQGGIVEKFSPTANGNVAPIQAFTTPYSLWTYITAVRTDNAGNVYVLDEQNPTATSAGINSVQEFAPTANGSVPPTRVTAGSNTQLNAAFPHDLAVTPDGALYVDVGSASENDLYYFAPGTSGNESPTCAFHDPRFWPMYMAYDGFTGVLDTISQDPSNGWNQVIASFSLDASTCQLTTVSYSAPFFVPYPLSNYLAGPIAVDQHDVYITFNDLSGGSLSNGPFGYDAFPKSSMIGSGYALNPPTVSWPANTTFGGTTLNTSDPNAIASIPGGTLWLGGTANVGDGVGELLTFPANASGSPAPASVIFGGGSTTTSCPFPSSFPAGSTNMCGALKSIANAP